MRRVRRLLRELGCLLMTRHSWYLEFWSGRYICTRCGMTVNTARD